MRSLHATTRERWTAERDRAGAGRLAPPTRVPDDAGSGSSTQDEVEDGVDRGLERAGAPVHLGEEKPSFERGEQGGGEVVGVDAGRECACGLTGSQSVAEGGGPPVEAGREEGAGLRVALGELTDERAELASTLCPVRLAAVITMSRQASTPFAPSSTCLLRVTMASAWWSMTACTRAFLSGK